MQNYLKQFDAKEVQLPETTFVHDIETKIFQAIVLQSLKEIKDVALAQGSLMGNLFGTSSPDRVSGISIEQDLKNHSVSVKVEVNISYGALIPAKAEEIQLKITQDLSRLTRLHVSCVHVVFKNLITAEVLEEKESSSQEKEEYSPHF